MGLGFESISKFNANPPFQTLQAQGVLTSPIFGFNFGPSGNELTLGGVDPRFNPDTDFTWIPITQEVCQTSKCV